MADRLPTVVQAAWLYYEDGLTQAEIAKKLSVSRATVGRLLEDARRSGVVTFHFHSSHLQALSLSQEIKDSFGLRDALVIPDLDRSTDQKAINDRVAKGAAQYLSSHMTPGSTMAIGWGDTVSRTLAELQHSFAGELRLVTMTGGTNAYIEAILLGNTEERSNSFRVRASIVPSPIIASSPEVASAFSAEEEVQDTLRACVDAPYALVGIGTPTKGSTLMESGYVKGDELDEIVAAGAVGDVLGQFFDETGAVLDVPIHRRRIGIDISDLAKRSQVVGVAGGELKATAITAAVYGGFIDVLVTDEATARLLLKAHKNRIADQAGAAV